MLRRSHDGDWFLSESTRAALEQWLYPQVPKKEYPRLSAWTISAFSTATARGAVLAASGPKGLIRRESFLGISRRMMGAPAELLPVHPEVFSLT